MNRDEMAALARGTVAVLSGAVVLLAIGVLISPWAVAALAAVAVADLALCARRVPRWRPW